LEHNQLLTRKLRIVPEQDGGKVVGIRLFGIRSDTPFADVGFENGDRLDSINGKSVASPEQALEAYASLQKMKTLELALVRRGLNTKLTIRFLD
jgi:general secretion pathway protein C